MDRFLSLGEMNLWIEQNYTNWIKDFYTFLKFPSISSESNHEPDMFMCANWLTQYLEHLDFQVENWPTLDHAVIFASSMKAGESKPTLLIYHHYDVQPVDPLEEWASPPFEPEIREGQVFARGAQDNKGQCFYVLQALKLLKEKLGHYPINIKLCIEGGEEIGSSGLSSILKDKKDKLRADYLAVVDAGIQKPNVPAITLGLRGIITFDLEIQTLHSDLHSGFHGGLAQNSIHTLVNLLSTLHNDKGEVTVPGFYDDVAGLSEKDKSLLSTSFNEKEYNQKFGLATGGEKSFVGIERTWIRPTLEINGINGGYTGTGFKTVIPAKASAKISCRLVSNQDPMKIAECVEKYLRSQAPENTQVRIIRHSGYGTPISANINQSITKCFAKAFEEVFRVPCEYIFCGGSIPIVTDLAKTAESEIILMGLGLDTDCIHAPNEHFGLDRIKQGILVMALAIKYLSEKVTN